MRRRLPTGSGGAQCTLGEVILMGGSALGANMIPANGKLLSISSFTALWSLYGTRYGGNGTSTLGVPNLKKSAAPNGLTYAICVSNAVFPDGPWPRHPVRQGRRPRPLEDR